MVISSPCLIDNKELTSPEQTAPALASPKQTAIGKDFSNPLIVDSLLKTIWSSMHHVFTMKHWLVQSKRLLHNMVAFLEKSTGSAGFHQVIDFLNRSHICYALTKKPAVSVSFIKQFWRSAEASTDENGELDDQDGITSIPNSEIFEQLALMGYHTDSDKLTFQKGAFSPQWRFLIHNILHCLSPKKTAWEQFSSNIATANLHFTFKRITSSPSHSPEPSSAHSPEPSTQHSPEHTTAAPTQPSPNTTIPNTTITWKQNLHLPDPMTHLPCCSFTLIGVLEDDLKKTKKTYSSTGRKLSDAEVQEKASTETEPFIQEVTPAEVIQDQGSSEKGSAEVSTAGAKKGTASEVPV
ncbi:hypothetical protein Tco_1221653, partial [Tanacetum coccineum]